MPTTRVVSVTVQTIVVVTCWIAALGLAVANIFVEAAFGSLALVFVVAGATLYIKGRIDRATRDWIQAYEVGRDVSRLRSATRSRSSSP